MSGFRKGHSFSGFALLVPEGRRNRTTVPHDSQNCERPERTGHPRRCPDHSNVRSHRSRCYPALLSSPLYTNVAYSHHGSCYTAPTSPPLDSDSAPVHALQRWSVNTSQQSKYLPGNRRQGIHKVDRKRERRPTWSPPPLLLSPCRVVLVNIELLRMQARIGLHQDGLAGDLFHLLQPLRVVSLELLDDLRVDPQHHVALV